MCSKANHKTQHNLMLGNPLDLCGSTLPCMVTLVRALHIKDALRDIKPTIDIDFLTDMIRLKLHRSVRVTVLKLHIGSSCAFQPQTIH